MKTGAKWIADLPDPELKTKLQKNADPKTLKKKYGGLANFIDDSMCWSNTPEGREYWNKVYTNLQNQKLCEQLE